MGDNLALLVEFPYLTADLVLNGMLIGAIFALAAYGMALVWGVLNIINLAQGELVILGGYLLFWLVSLGMAPLAALPLVIAMMFALGWLLYYGVIYRLIGRDMFLSLLATFGVSILLQQLLNQTFGADVRSVDPGLGTYLLADGAIPIAKIKLIAFGLAVLIGLALWLFLGRSHLGQAIRATAQNAVAARLLGVAPNRIYGLTFAINSALCGTAGALAVMAWTIHPYAGLAYTIRSFLIVIVAGVGNVGGVVMAGFGLGALENLAGFVFGAEFQMAFVFALMVLLLVWRNFRLARHRGYLA